MSSHIFTVAILHFRFILILSQWQDLQWSRNTQIQCNILYQCLRIFTLSVRKWLYVSWRDIFMFTDLKRYKVVDCYDYEESLPWCGTEEPALGISQQLGILASHIFCMDLVIAMCCFCQFLLTFGEKKLLPHSVATIDVNTVAWCCRHNKDLLHPAECPRRVPKNIWVTVYSKCLHYMSLHWKV